MMCMYNDIAILLNQLACLSHNLYVSWLRPIHHLYAQMYTTTILTS